MKSFLDTSVLIPVFYGDHTHHTKSLDIFVRCTKNDSCCGAHSLVEVYSALTRMPGKHRISCEQTMLFIGDIREHLTIIALDGNEYFETLRKAADSGLVGGVIYDAILARCAIKSNAEVIYTWNVRHFSRLGEEVKSRTRTP
jgi:predicted nucleic acid-binding protein